MVYLGLEPGATGWQAQTNPLSYGSIQSTYLLNMTSLNSKMVQICLLILTNLGIFLNILFLSQLNVNVKHC